MHCKNERRKKYENPTPIDGMNDDSLFLTINYHGGERSTININEIAEVKEV